MIELLNRCAQQWAVYSGPAVIQNTVFLGLVLFALHRMRNAAAGIRYTVGLIGVLKLLLPPLIKVPELVSAPESLRLLAVTHPLSGTFIPMPGGTAMPPAGMPASPGPAAILMVLWAACVLGCIFVSIVRTARLALLLRDATPLSRAVAAAAGAGDDVRVYRSDRIAMPLTLGVLPRKIFVPSAWDHWPSECRCLIIRHEMAHIQRHDGVFQVLQIAAQALYWFHPLAWLLNRRVGEYREMACDDACIGGERDRSVAYSRYLVEIAESVMCGPVPCESASALIRQRNELLTRVRYQMKGGAMMRMTRRKTMMALAGLVLLMLPLSLHFAGATAGRPAATAGRPVAAVLPGATVRSSPDPGNAGASGTPAAEGGAREVIEIRVGRDAALKVNGAPTGLDELEDALKRFAGGKKKGPVIKLVCDPSVSMGTIYRLQEILRKLDLMKMEYLTMQGEGLTLALPPLDVDKKLEEIPDENIAVIAIGAMEQVTFLGEGTFEPKDVGKIIRTRLAGNPTLIVWIRATDESRYGSFLTVLEEAKKAGAKRILVNGN